MIDHTVFAVSDLQRSKAFYAKALAPLGVSLLREIPPRQAGAAAMVGFGAEGKPFFWLTNQGAPGGSLHIALRAASRAQVDAFHEAALEAGGVDNGPPGLRAHYHASYYGAFVLDPDGVNIEAVCHLPA